MKKRCKKCDEGHGRYKPISSFARNKANKDGRDVFCKDCMREMENVCQNKFSTGGSDEEEAS